MFIVDISMLIKGLSQLIARGHHLVQGIGLAHQNLGGMKSPKYTQSNPNPFSGSYPSLHLYLIFTIACRYIDHKPYLVNIC